MKRGRIKVWRDNFALATSLEKLGWREDLARLRKVCYLMRDAYGGDGSDRRDGLA